MAVGYTTYTANAVLNAVGNNASFAVATAYIKLHIGDPGAAGTTNPAVETTRKAISFGTGAAAAMTTDAIITWTAVAAGEDYTHFSLWDTVGPAGGNCLWTGTVTAVAVTAGANFELPVGDLDLSMTPAS